MKLSGYVCVRNGDSLDYCWELAVSSLLPVCDEVVICDSDSTDGTKQRAEYWAAYEPKIRVINYPWPDPKGDSNWWVTWLNFARRHLKHEMQICLDADEVLSDDENCHQAVSQGLDAGMSLTFDRLNFWRDPHSLIPDGYCCGKWVTRMGPSEYHMPSDEPHHAGELPIIDHAIRDSRLKIFHLGFLRKTEAFYAKAKVVLPAFFHRYDQRLEFAERDGKKVHESECEYNDKLVPYHGYYPEKVIRWLNERGYEVA